MRSIVTMNTNVETNEEGQFIYDENGNIVLKNEEDVGILVKIHVTQVQQMENGVLYSGISTLAEVYWNLRRSPAPALVSPNDIAWVSFDVDAASEETEDEIEEIEELEGVYADQNNSDEDEYIEEDVGH